MAGAFQMSELFHYVKCYCRRMCDDAGTDATWVTLACRGITIICDSDLITGTTKPRQFVIVLDTIWMFVKNNNDLYLFITLDNSTCRNKLMNKVIVLPPLLTMRGLMSSS